MASQTFVTVALAVLAGYMTLLTLWITASIRALSNKVDTVEARLRDELHTGDGGLRGEIAGLRGEVRTGFAEVRGEIGRLSDRVDRLEGRGPLVRP